VKGQPKAFPGFFSFLFEELGLGWGGFFLQFFLFPGNLEIIITLLQIYFMIDCFLVYCVDYILD